MEQSEGLCGRLDRRRVLRSKRRPLPAPQLLGHGPRKCIGSAGIADRSTFEPASGSVSSSSHRACAACSGCTHTSYFRGTIPVRHRRSGAVSRMDGVVRPGAVGHSNHPGAVARADWRSAVVVGCECFYLHLGSLAGGNRVRPVSGRAYPARRFCFWRRRMDAALELPKTGCGR